MTWVLLSALSAGLAVALAMRPTGLRRLSPHGSRGGPLRASRQRRAGHRATSAQRRAEAAARAVVPQVCELLALCVDAGQPLRTAARIVARALPTEAGDPLRSVDERLELGADEQEAWRWLADHPGYGSVGRELARASRHGTGLSARLRAHASDARRDAAAARQELARRAGVTSVLPLVACYLPAFLLLGVVPIFGALVGSWVG